MTLDNVNKIFFLTSSWSKERINNVFYHINNLGLDNDKRVDIHYINKFESLYKDNELFKVLSSKYLSQQKGEENENIKVINYFNNFINHYYIISESYFLNYDYIIVCEDDLYINDFNEFKILLNNIPDDSDFVQFHNKWNFITNKISLVKYNEYFYKLLKPRSYTLNFSFISKKLINKIYNYYLSCGITYADSWQYTNYVLTDDINTYMPIHKVMEDEKFKSNIYIK